jgi:hypothetical protein
MRVTGRPGSPPPELLDYEIHAQTVARKWHVRATRPPTEVVGSKVPPRRKYGTFRAHEKPSETALRMLAFVQNYLCLLTLSVPDRECPNGP